MKIEEGERERERERGREAPSGILPVKFEQLPRH